MSIIKIDPVAMHEHLLAMHTRHIQTRLDEFARTREYADILHAVSYQHSTVPKFAAEGKRALYLRDQTWLRATAIYKEVASGKRLTLTPAELLAELPALTWE